MCGYLVILFVYGEILGLWIGVEVCCLGFDVLG